MISLLKKEKVNAKVVNFLIVDDVDVTRDLLRGLIQSIATAQVYVSDQHSQR